MKKLILGLMLSSLVFTVNAFGAEGLNNRSCNLQAREIALRINEEVIGSLNAEQRALIADIAEEVCQDYGTSGIEGRNRVMGRADEARNQDLPASATATVSDSGEVDSEDDSGLLGGLRIIEPEDRVKRPGLKRR